MLKNSKRILIVAPYGFNDRMSNFIEYVSARLLAANGWQAVALVKSDHGIYGKENLNNIAVFRYQSFGQGLVELFKIFIIFSPKIIHVHNLRNNRIGIIVAMISRLLMRKLFFTEYGLLHDHFLVADRDRPIPIKLKPNGIIKNLKELIVKSFFNKNDSIKNNFKNYVFHWALTHAQKVVFVSQHNIPIAKELGIKGEMVYLPQIIDDVSWSYSKADVNDKVEENHQRVRDILNQIKNQPYAVFVGQLKLRKGWDLMLRAIPNVADNLVKYFVFISGSTIESTPEFSRIVEETGTKERVLFFGKVVDRALLKEIYLNSKVIVMPSRYEGFGLVTVEAFEVGKPLVACDVPAINENIIDGVNGLLFPLEDYQVLAQKISQAVSDEILVQKIVGGGKQSLAKFKSQTTKNQWLEFYNSQR